MLALVQIIGLLFASCPPGSRTSYTATHSDIELSGGVKEMKGGLDVVGAISSTNREEPEAFCEVSESEHVSDGLPNRVTADHNPT